MDLNTALNKLYSLQKFGIKLGLQNIGQFLQRLGNPQEHFQSFHVAGTNGKGSTSSFIASILTEAGYKTGLYTSPHFVRFNERVRIDGIEVPDDYISSFIADNWDYIESRSLTFFEATTALAFSYFADKNVSFAVIETGLGGRLDATNVLKPLASVITSISLEHVEILGNTLEEIAGEKAGIIKNKTDVFTGRLPLAALKVVEDKAAQMDGKLFRLGDYLVTEEGRIDLKYLDLFIPNINPPLNGHHQKFNASLAVLALAVSAGIRSKDIILRGISSVVKNTGIEGRYEIFSLSPRVIFDSAHNSEGVENFLLTFKEESNNYKKRVLLFGVMKDKAITEMLGGLAEYFDEVYLTSIDYERCASPEDLTSIASHLNIKTSVETDGAGFINSFISGKNKDHCLVVLGSMYVLGHIKAELRAKKKLDILS